MPLYKVLAHNYNVPDTILTNGDALAWVTTSDQIMFQWFPGFEEVVVSNLTFVSVDETGSAYSSIVPPSYGYFNLIVERAKEVACDLTTNACALASALGKLTNGK